MTTKSTAPEVIGEREAARLAKHFLGLEAKRQDLSSQARLIEKEQTAIKAQIEAFVLDQSPKDRVVVLAKAILRVATVASARYIGWKGVCLERLGAGVVAEIEANPPSKDVVSIDHNVGGEAVRASGRRAA